MWVTAEVEARVANNVEAWIEALLAKMEDMNQKVNQNGKELMEVEEEDKKEVEDLR